LILASETVLSAFDDRCPVAFDNALSNYKEQCDSCKEEDTKFCWRDHFIQEAKKEIIKD
jgi:hypothetical protein